MAFKITGKGFRSFQTPPARMGSLETTSTRHIRQLSSVPQKGGVGDPPVEDAAIVQWKGHIVAPSFGHGHGSGKVIRRRLGKKCDCVGFMISFAMHVAMMEKNYFTSSDPHRDIILKHIRHKFWHSFCPSVSRFHQNYPLLLVPSPGSGSSSDHCDLSSQTDSNWLSLCLIQNNFRRPGVSRRLGVSRRPGVSRRLGAWELRFERYKTIWLS